MSRQESSGNLFLSSLDYGDYIKITAISLLFQKFLLVPSHEGKFCKKRVKLFPISFVLLSDEAQKYRKINPKAPRFRDKCRRREDSACSFVSMQGVPPVLPGNGTNPTGALWAH